MNWLGREQYRVRANQWLIAGMFQGVSASGTWRLLFSMKLNARSTGSSDSPSREHSSEDTRILSDDELTHAR
jgi:hypothetical protein